MAQAKKWQELDRKLVFAPPYVWRVEERHYRLPNGETGDYYIQAGNATVCVLALTTDRRVITLPQYRPGPDAILRELPGGGLEDGEDAVTAGLRELREETGYSGEVKWSASSFEHAYSETVKHVVVAADCRKVGDQQFDGREFGEVELVAIADFVAQVRDGKLTDVAGAMLALDHLGLL